MPPTEKFLAFLDTETGGLTAGKDPVIEIATILEDLAGHEIARFEEKIMLRAGDVVSPEAANVNGYDDAVWARAAVRLRHEVVGSSGMTLPELEDWAKKLANDDPAEFLRRFKNVMKFYESLGPPKPDWADSFADEWFGPGRSGEGAYGKLVALLQKRFGPAIDALEKIKAGNSSWQTHVDDATRVLARLAGREEKQ